MGSRKRILFFAEGATMAHFVRPLALANATNADLYEVHFRAPARFQHHLKNAPFEVGTIDAMSGDDFLRNLARAKPMFPVDVIRKYVEEDRGIIRDVRPDLVVGDMRPSLAISAKVEKVPSAIMMNGYWSPFNIIKPEIVPELGWITRLFPPRRFGWAYRKLEPGAVRGLVKPTNVVRAEYQSQAGNQLDPLPADLRQLYNAGDYVLYPDVEAFVKTKNLPANHHYVGICEWNPQIAKPDWWGEMVADKRKKVFVSLGSSGPVRVLPQLLQALRRLDVAAVLSSSGRQMPALWPGVYMAKLLPFKETAELSALVVSHGGSGGLYPAMAAGTPVLGIPSNGDQHMSTEFLVHHGAGLGVRVEEASEPRLYRELSRLLNEEGFVLNARKWIEPYKASDSGALFNAFLASVFPAK